MWGVTMAASDTDDVVDVLLAQHAQVKLLLDRVQAAGATEKGRLFTRLLDAGSGDRRTQKRSVCTARNSTPSSRTSIRPCLSMPGTRRPTSFHGCATRFRSRSCG